MDALEGLDHGSPFSSNNGDDSNALILTGKRKKKSKEKGLKQRGPLKLKKKDKPKPSNSQKRKLKKLEEEKGKADLLAKSLETLEKYKIQDDAYSLMWSSRSLGQLNIHRLILPVRNAEEKSSLLKRVWYYNIVTRLKKDWPLVMILVSEPDSSEIYSDPDVEEDFPIQTINRDIDITSLKSSPQRSCPELPCSKNTEDIGALESASFANKLDNEHANPSVLKDPKASLPTSSCKISTAKSKV